MEKTPPNQTIKPDQKSPISCVETSCKNNNTPNPLKVPKAFKYPERYRSPTDQVLSPISKGLLARRKKLGPILPPTKTPPKIPDQCSQGVGLFQS
ncbi:hypothetical protein AQUCO_00600434v1 [Aquilegia coerulea]|uniref:Uncharacterized protein n=1 Tax=Aquilegia coerulea TaxID=218851 RepID=A0A2G5EPQ5_AQUCA|nr:hypothetical protein AQUCO_00600434v1 [Aquilegia coerulea]